MISAIKLSLILSVLATVESGNNRFSINPNEQAYGVLQIRQPVIDDVNNYCLQDYVLSDALDPVQAHRIAEKYLRLWCSVNQKYTYEDVARTWNGGPDGWWKLSTLKYWYKVEAELKRRGLDSRGTIEEWQPPRINKSPAARSAFIHDTTAAFSSPSAPATQFHFVLSVPAAKAALSTSFTFTIRPSASPRVLPPASPPLTLRLAIIRVDAPSSESFNFFISPHVQIQRR